MNGTSGCSTQFRSDRGAPASGSADPAAGSVAGRSAGARGEQRGVEYRGRDASEAGNQRARFFNAAGSASESLAALKVAVAWGYLGAEEAGSAALLLGRVLAMLKKLARR
jgi:hypothetical protein